MVIKEINDGIGSYAIVKASGRQLWVEENRFYDLNNLALCVGDKFTLNKILLVSENKVLSIGKPFLEGQYVIEATVIRHLSGSKTRVYKMRPKKKTRKTFGSRQKLTRIFINTISCMPISTTLCHINK